MRFFRIPAFTGIEAHRDDADRGSLRVVEGCLPYGPGGLRSGPVWEKVGDVSLKSTDSENHLHGADDGRGNSVLTVSRNDEVHDMAIISTENTEIEQFGSQYIIANPVNMYSQDKAVLAPVGNQLYSFGDGDGEAVFVGKASEGVRPDQLLYSYEYSMFPNCKFFVQGPKKTIFAAGNPDKPLRVYVSEPASKTSPYRDSPYSTESPGANAFEGELSVVDILGSNATKITALSSRGNQVVVHTNKGCHLLYEPSSDQAETGYRVEQAPATNFSAAVGSQVVAGETGSMSYWLGHDGQIYKDESAARGAEDVKNYADPAQVSWKAKSVWEKELPTDLSDSFSAYDRQSGMYWVYVKDDGYASVAPSIPSAGPANLSSSVIVPSIPSAGPSSVNTTILKPSLGPVITSVTAVQPANSRACESVHVIGAAVQSDGSLWTWGSNFTGQLLDGTTTHNYTPTKVVASDVISVSRYAQTLFIKTDGSLWGGGQNADGSLGDGSTTNRLTPVQLVSSGVLKVAASNTGYHYIKTDGSLWAIGSNAYGKLGDGTKTGHYMSPKQIISSGVVDVSSHEINTIIAKNDGSVWATGRNHYGQLGDGTTTEKTSFTQVISSGVSRVFHDGYKSFALKNDGSLWAWGRNNYGQLGDGTTVDRHAPVKVVDSGVVDVAVGTSHALIVKDDGSLWGAGIQSQNQFGLGAVTTGNWGMATTFTQIRSSGAAQIVTELYSVSLVRDNGAVEAWGYNASGQLGTGNTTGVFGTTPAQIFGVGSIDPC